MKQEFKIGILLMLRGEPGITTPLWPPQMMSQDTMTMLIPKYGMIIKLDDNGTITDSLHDPSGKYMDEITDVYEDAAEKVLYLGSYKHEFLGRLKINS